MGCAATRQEKLRVIKDQHRFAKLMFAMCLTAIISGILLLAPLVNTQHWTASAATPPAPQASKWVAQMPDGNAKSIIVAKCQLCHSLGRVVISHRSKDDWMELVGSMIDRGTTVTPDELPIVIDYLVANFGPADSNSPTATSADTAQAGPASATDLIVDPDKAQYSAAPDSMGLPNGVQISAVSGDPSKTGLFSILLKIPAGLVIPPHWLSGDENIVCLRGTFQFGEGRSFDAGKLQALNPGAVLHVPAQMHYFALAKDSTVILVYGNGPLSMTSK
jgi:quercetin dioxygenase-like cupin family protein